MVHLVDHAHTHAHAHTHVAAPTPALLDLALDLYLALAHALNPRVVVPPTTNVDDTHLRQVDLALLDLRAPLLGDVAAAIPARVHDHAAPFRRVTAAEAWIRIEIPLVEAAPDAAVVVKAPAVQDDTMITLPSRMTPTEDDAMGGDPLDADATLLQFLRPPETVANRLMAPKMQLPQRACLTTRSTVRATLKMHKHITSRAGETAEREDAPRENHES
jgi:hypothetical protein